MNFILNVVYCMYYKSNKACAFRGEKGIVGGVDFVIVDIPEGLPVPKVSFPLISVLEWNLEDKNFLAMVFDFGSFFFHDSEVFLFFYKDDLKLQVDIRGSTRAYHFKILHEWTGINHLPITIAKDASKIVSDSFLVTCFIF